MTHFLRLPAHDYNTGVALNHHTHYDHSGHSGGGVVKEATIPSLCDAPGVLQRAQVVMRPGIEGLALQLQHPGFQLPPEWWWPLRCNQSAQVVQQTNLAVMLTGLIRSFVEPKVWNSIGLGVRSLCPPPHCTPQLFFCPSDRSRPQQWSRAVDGLSELLLLQVNSTHTVEPPSDKSNKLLQRCDISQTMSKTLMRRAMAKWRCHDEVGKREAIQGWAFDWVAMLRFDVAYFGPMPSLASLPPGVIVPSNHGKAFGMSRSQGWLSDHLVVVTRAHSAHYFYHPCNNVPELLNVSMPAEVTLEAQLARSGAPVYLRFFPWVIVRCTEGHKRGRAQYLAECFRHTPSCVLPSTDSKYRVPSADRIQTSGLVELLDNSSARMDHCSNVHARGPVARLRTCELMFLDSNTITPCTTIVDCGRLFDQWTHDACVEDWNVEQQQRRGVVKKCDAHSHRGPIYLAASRRQRLDTLPPSTGQAPSVRPSFLYLLSDDFRADDVTTAILSQLPMQHALRFRETFPSAVVCVASRASFLTGRHPGTLGSLDNHDSMHWCKWDHPGSKPRSCPVLPAPMRSAFSTLPTLLRQAGWLTAALGKVFHVDENTEAYTVPYARDSAPLLRRVCQDERAVANRICARTKAGNVDQAYCACDLKEHATWPDEDIARIAVQRLKTFERMGAPQQPFLLIAGFLRPHVPAHAPVRSLVAADAAKAQLFKRGVRRASRWGGQARFYHGAVAFCVEQMGRVLKHLHASPMANTTSVIFHSDHGLGLGEWMSEEGKWHTHLSDASLRVPLVISVPWWLERSSIDLSRPVSLLDVVPTILQLAGLNKVSQQLRLPGRSVMAQDHPGSAVTQSVSAYTVRTREWRYVRREPANASRWWSPCTQQVWSVCKGAINNRDPIELYRVMNVEGGIDAQNLATAPGMEAVFSDMERILCKGDANLELCLKRCKLGRQTAFCNEVQGTEMVPTETKVQVKLFGIYSQRDGSVYQYPATTPTQQQIMQSPTSQTGWRPCSHEVAPGNRLMIAAALDRAKQRYYFCGRSGTIEKQPASMLRFKYVQPCLCKGVCRMFNRGEATRLLRGKWLHFDGDSLTRDMIYDLIELLNGTVVPRSAGSRCLRSRLHNAFTHHVGGVRITLGWNPALEDAAKLAAMQASAEPLTDAETSWWKMRPNSGPSRTVFPDRPDVWVWSDKPFARAPDKPQFELMVRRVQAQAARYTEMGGTRFIMRTITPFFPVGNSIMSRAFSLPDTLAPRSVTLLTRVPSAKRAKYSVDDYQEWIYHQSRERFSDFCQLDAWSMMASRPDLWAPTDGVHATGIVSQWMTALVLNAIKRNQCARGSSCQATPLATPPFLR